MLKRLFPTIVLRRRLELPSSPVALLIQSLLREHLPQPGHTPVADASKFYGLHLESRFAHFFALLSSELKIALYDELGFSDTVTRFYIGRSWPVVRFREGGARHFHAGAMLSGVFYLQVPDGAGGIEFLKPYRFAADSLYRRPGTEQISPTHSEKV